MIELTLHESGGMKVAVSAGDIEAVEQIVVRIDNGAHRYATRIHLRSGSEVVVVEPYTAVVAKVRESDAWGEG